METGLSAEGLLAAYAAGDATPLQALQAVLERVARLNPELNAFAVMNPGALAQAWESARRWEAGKPKGILDGIPVTVKDLIDVAGLPTRRGSKVTDAAPALADAPVVAALRAAGAVIWGKTTTTEFGWKSPGDCPATGITRNFWSHDHTPGGSSAGAAAAAAAGFGPLHVGTDAGGSIRIPAAWSGVVGMKPTFGRVPQWPLGAFGHVAVAGPMARGVRDAALMLSAMAVFDGRDPFSLRQGFVDFREGIEAGAKGMRIGVLGDPGFDAPVDVAGRDAVVAAREILAGAGAEMFEMRVELPDISGVFSKIWGVALARLVDGVPVEKRGLLDDGLVGVAERFRGVSGLEMLEAEALRVKAAHEMAEQKYDALICPCVPRLAPAVGEVFADPVEALWKDWAPWTFLFNLTRQPAVSVPMGFAGGLPVAVQVAGKMYDDAGVLRVARVLELGASRGAF